ncbi:MAG: hypothetical protein J6A96_00860 [Clostridia bacterium]|nr:hypothetical protein [Clostridia bacterium]
MKKKILVLILCLVMVLSLASCTVGHIKDTNGDTDFSLGTIDDERMLNGVSSYVQNMAIKSEKDGIITYKANKFSGVYVLKKIPYAVGKQMTIKTSITVESGNFRAVLIQNGEIIKDLPLGENQVTIIDEPRRDYEIRIAGESAKFDLTLEYIIEE